MRVLPKYIAVATVGVVLVGAALAVRFGDKFGLWRSAGPVSVFFQPLPSVEAERVKFTLQQKAPDLFTKEQLAAMKDVSLSAVPLDIVDDTTGAKSSEYLVKMESPAFCNLGRCPFFLAKRVEGPEKINDVGLYALASKVLVSSKKVLGHPDLIYVDNVVGQPPVTFRWEENPDDDGFSYAPSFFDEK